MPTIPKGGDVLQVIERLQNNAMLALKRFKLTVTGKSEPAESSYCWNIPRKIKLGNDSTFISIYCRQIIRKTLILKHLRK